jgi:hypothetical protein
LFNCVCRISASIPGWLTWICAAGVETLWKVHSRVIKGAVIAVNV